MRLSPFFYISIYLDLIPQNHFLWNEVLAHQCQGRFFIFSLLRRKITRITSTNISPAAIPMKLHILPEAIISTPNRRAIMMKYIERRVGSHTYFLLQKGRFFILILSVIAPFIAVSGEKDLSFRVPYRWRPWQPLFLLLKRPFS